MRDYYVYILSSRSRTLYVGVSNDIIRRLQEHRSGNATTFVTRYRVHRLVPIEQTDDIDAAIQREKQIKGWRREKKIALISEMNPGWEDLSEGWVEVDPELHMSS